jgi:hypothetical protein
MVPQMIEVPNHRRIVALGLANIPMDLHHLDSFFDIAGNHGACNA